MQTITVEGWKDFESRLREIKRTIKAGPVGLLFRGQADASWSLQTSWSGRAEEWIACINIIALFAK